MQREIFRSSLQMLLQHQICTQGGINLFGIHGKITHAERFLKDRAANMEDVGASVIDLEGILLQKRGNLCEDLVPTEEIMLQCDLSCLVSQFFQLRLYLRGHFKVLFSAHDQNGGKISVFRFFNVSVLLQTL